MARDFVWLVQKFFGGRHDAIATVRKEAAKVEHKQVQIDRMLSEMADLRSGKGGHHG